MRVRHFFASLRSSCRYFAEQLRQPELAKLATTPEPSAEPPEPAPIPPLRVFKTKSLPESDRILRAVTSSMPIMLLVVDSQGFITVARTEGMGPLAGRDWGQMGSTVWECYADSPQVLENCRRGLAGETFYSEVSIDGYVLDSYIAPLRSEDGMSDGFICVARDITERRQAQRERDELIAREQTARAELTNMLDSITDGFYALDRDWRFTYVNSKAEQVLNHSFSQLMGRQIWDVFPEMMDTRFATEYQRAMNQGQTAAFEEYYPAYNGWYSIRVYPAPDGISVFFLDITERKQAETLQRDLLLRLTTVQEEERWRIARDLHDQLGQDLAVLMLGLKSLPHYGVLVPTAAACVQELQDTVTQLIKQVRHVALNLRSEALGTLGLPEALRRYTKEWSHHHSIPVTFHTWGFQGQRVAPYIEAALYRIVQESFTNVVRHSNAQNVSVVLERRDDHILLIVEDDGDGFDVEATMNGPFSERGLGLQGMNERVGLVSGTLQIESRDGDGATIYVRIPDSGKTERPPAFDKPAELHREPQHVLS